MPFESTFSDQTSGYFQLLPDDCVIDILHFLDRDSLDQLQLVNRRMHSISNLPKFQSVKREMGTLVVSNEKNCHKVFLKEPSGLRALCEFDHLELINHTNISEFPVPLSIFSWLRRFLSKNRVFILNFRNVFIDQVFIDNVRQLLSPPSTVTHFKLQSAHCSPAITPFERKTLLYALTTFGISSITLSHTQLYSEIEEQFIHTLAAIEGFPHLLNIIDRQRDMNIRIKPSKGIINSLWKFRYLTMPVMVLPTEWLAEAMAMRLKGTNINGSWEICLTDEVTWPIVTNPDSNNVFVELAEHWRGRIVNVENGNCASVIKMGKEENYFRVEIYFLDAHNFPQGLESAISKGLVPLNGNCHV